MILWHAPETPRNASDQILTELRETYFALLFDVAMPLPHLATDRLLSGAVGEKSLLQDHIMKRRSSGLRGHFGGRFAGMCVLENFGRAT